MNDAIAAYAHYVAILATVALACAELAIYRATLTAAYVRALQRTDSWFGIAAGLLLVTGIGRIFASGKAWAFYEHNPIFWVKMALVAMVAIISIWPTIHFLSWRKLVASDGSISVDPVTFSHIRGLILIEVVILFCIPFFASLMSRGIGLQ